VIEFEAMISTVENLVAVIIKGIKLNVSEVQESELLIKEELLIRCW
jgi:hypothetical protein